MREAFDADPVSVFADVIKNGSRAGLTKAAICKAVIEQGLPADIVGKAWKAPALKAHPHIVLTGTKWSWSDEAKAQQPKQTRPKKAVSAQASADQVPGVLLRVLTELAIDVEELVANGASSQSVLERLHIRMKAQGLTPIGKVDEKIVFDRQRHRAVAGSLSDGSTVFVVRPGYMWHAGGKETLVEKALVIQ